jgi:hypothetical protein
MLPQLWAFQVRRLSQSRVELPLCLCWLRPLSPATIFDSYLTINEYSAFGLSASQSLFELGSSRCLHSFGSFFPFASVFPLIDLLYLYDIMIFGLIVG